MKPDDNRPRDAAPRDEPAPRPRVLVAEDCPDSRRAVCSFLAHAGLDVTPAENGRVAVTLSRSRHFDLVLLDMQMPEVDGYEAARQLRKDGFRGPVIALTGDVEPGDEEACHEAGCDAYLAKPWAPEQLLQVVESHLQFKPSRPPGAAVPTPVRESPSLRQVAREFARSLPSALAEIQAALAVKDRRQVGRLAHQLSGAAGLFEFPELCQAARVLERAARDDMVDESAVGQRVRALADIIRRIAQGLGDET